jgi:NADH-quinone oxidoreductase subunit E
MDRGAIELGMAAFGVGARHLGWLDKLLRRQDRLTSFEGSCAVAHYILELILWILASFFVGCCIGCLLRKMFGAKAPEAASPEIRAPHVPAPSAPHAAPKQDEAAALAAMPAKMDRPRGITAARGGKPDDLQRISGIGPKNEKVLHTLGFFHFDQIAAWTAAQVAWVDDHLKFNGRIAREEWVKQARLLADGKEDEFAKLYGTGGLKDDSGQSRAGSRTRKT